MRSVNHIDREADDAPPSRKQRIARIILLFVVFDVGALAVFLWVRGDGGSSPPPAPSATTLAPVPAVSMVPAVPLPAPVAAPAPPPPPSTPTKRALAKASTPAKTTLPVVIASVSGGDGVVRGAVEGAFRRSLSRAGVEPAGDAAHSVTLRVENSDAGDTLTVRCSVSIARLPGRNVVGALSARADVGAGDAPVDELYGDAADACARTLAGDLASWLRSHR
jgi:hypothetical protein